jgi:prepilin-type N-terminal cleavage/methylation domain-containing protein
MMSLVNRLRDEDRQAGFTLIEMLVAVVLMSLIGTALLSVVFGANRSATATKSQQDLNEEARLAINRMARELRQANGLATVLNPDGPSYSSSAITALTFTADFNGDGCIDGAHADGTTTGCAAYQSSNPETLTYCWNPAASVRQLFLISGRLGAGGGCVDSSNHTGLPILAGQVTSFKLTYRSNQYLYDTNGDGVTSWLEIDQADPPVGNQNGLLDANELPKIDSIVIDLGVSANGAHAQTYTTQVDLRNLS